MRAVISLSGALLLVASGCLGPVASLYPPPPREPATPVWVVDHGWHTGLVLDRADIPPGLVREQADFADARYLEIGWGDAGFYRAADAGPALALKAALASGSSVLHLVGLPMPPAAIFAGREIVEVPLSRPGFAALVAFVDGSFARGPGGRAVALGPGLSSSAASAFYAARGRYHLLNTCNTWIAEALRAGGVPVTPAYAVTAGNLMWQVRRLQGHVVPGP